MKLTIIVDDKAVYIDGVMKAYAPLPLDLSECGIPTNVHALQWNETAGWIEFKDNPDFTKDQNEVINALPDWANNCVNVYNIKIAQIQEQQALAQNKQPTTTGTQTL